jgi:hypothetical protein
MHYVRYSKFIQNQQRCCEVCRKFTFFNLLMRFDRHHDFPLQVCSRSAEYAKKHLQLSNDRLCGLVVRVSGYRFRGPGYNYWLYQIF